MKGLQHVGVVLATGLFLLVGSVLPALAGQPAHPPPPRPVAVPCDTGALIKAINEANAAGGAVLDLAPGCTYTLTAPQPNTETGLPPITAPITIHGNAATITRSTAAGTPDFRIFEVLAAPARLNLSRLTISNGFGVGDQAPEDGHSGGGILVREGGALAADGVAVTGNAGFVAGIHNYGTADLVNSVVSGNNGVQGGGINNADGTLTVRRSAIRDNTASGADIGIGGGILNSDTGTATVADSLIRDNNTQNAGGGVWNAGTLHLRGTQITNNTAAQLHGAPLTVEGGGLLNIGHATIERTSINRNHAQHGPGATRAVAGGIANSAPETGAAEVTLRDSAVVANTSVEAPGGILNDSGPVTLTHTAVTGNTPTNCDGSPTPVPGCVG